MKLHWVLICTLTIIALSGCGSGEIHLPSENAAAESGSGSPVSDSPAASVESPEIPESEVFQPPFPTNGSFFSPPRLEKASAPSNVLPGDGQQVKVRVIGFSQLGDNEPQALLEIDGSLAAVHSGDSVGGVRVIAVDSPNVTLQHRNDRWTVALFDQPLVHDQVSPLTQRQSAVGRRARPASSELSRNEQVDGNLPPAPTSLPADNLPPTVSLPSDLDLPVPPELPELETPAGQSLPGLDAIPQLPSL